MAPQFWEIATFALLAFGLGALVALASALSVGVLVLRTKRDAYEPLLPPLTAGKKDETAFNLDEFPEEELPKSPLFHHLTAEASERMKAQMEADNG